MAKVQFGIGGRNTYVGKGPIRHHGNRMTHKRIPVEEEDDDAEPEWIDFDPKAQAQKNFFGRAIPNESELRLKAKEKREEEEKLF